MTSEISHFTSPLFSDEIVVWGKKFPDKENYHIVWNDNKRETLCGRRVPLSANHLLNGFEECFINGTLCRPCLALCIYDVIDLKELFVKRTIERNHKETPNSLYTVGGCLMLGRTVEFNYRARLHIQTSPHILSLHNTECGVDVSAFWPFKIIDYKALARFDLICKRCDHAYTIKSIYLELTTNAS